MAIMFYQSWLKGPFRMVSKRDAGRVLLRSKPEIRIARQSKALYQARMSFRCWKRGLIVLREIQTICPNERHDALNAPCIIESVGGIIQHGRLHSTSVASPYNASCMNCAEVCIASNLQMEWNAMSV